MITSKELQYVNDWARRIPMPGEEYSKKIMEELKLCVEAYNAKYRDKEYNIIFSNSEEIKFEIMSKNLCHMLGIDFQNIMGQVFNNYRKDVFGVNPETSLTSYDLLSLILEHSDKVIELDNDPKNSLKVINYYKSGIKCAIFNKLSDFDKFNFAVINKDANSKLFFIPSNEAVCPYFVMGTQKDNNTVDNIFYVNTLLAPQEPKMLFENEEVIIPTQILISNEAELNKIIATPEEKIKLLNMYKNIINQYGIPNKINIYGDYESMLNDLENNSFQRSLRK